MNKMNSAKCKEEKKGFEERKTTYMKEVNNSTKNFCKKHLEIVARRDVNGMAGRALLQSFEEGVLNYHRSIYTLDGRGVRGLKEYDEEDDIITSEEEFKQEQLKFQSQYLYNFRLIRDVCTYLLDKEVGNQSKVDKLDHVIKYLFKKQKDLEAEEDRRAEQIRNEQGREQLMDDSSDEEGPKMRKRRTLRYTPRDS